MSKRVALLMGGRSAEREVSLVSGKACALGLRQRGYDVDVIDVRDDLGALLAALDHKPDVVFNALHGRFGEDGRVQGLLDLLGLPYTHSGVLASALAMDKPLAKQVFGAVGLRCPEGKVMSIDRLAKGDPMPRPFVVKPPAEGSSVGVRIVREGDNLPVHPGGNAALGATHDLRRPLLLVFLGRFRDPRKRRRQCAIVDRRSAQTRAVRSQDPVRGGPRGLFCWRCC